MNKWQVYEFCKAHRETLMQIPISGQVKYLKKRLPGVELEILTEGLLEFRSVPPHNWGQQIIKAVR